MKIQSLIVGIMFSSGLFLHSELYAGTEKPAVKVAEDAPSGSLSKALAVLQRASSHLANAPFFSVKAEIWQEYPIKDGAKLQFTKLVSLELRRPDRLHVQVDTDTPRSALWYDGKQLILLNRKENLYGITAAPASLDAVVARVEKDLGFVLPLDDLLVEEPFATVKDAEAGQYLGLEPVLGRRCHHLAFQHATADCQIWIEEGAVPVIRKMLITHKKVDGIPAYTALFSGWDFVTALPDYLFTFEPPPGASRIAILETDGQASADQDK